MNVTLIETKCVADGRIISDFLVASGFEFSTHQPGEFHDLIFVVLTSTTNHELFSIKSRLEYMRKNFQHAVNVRGLHYSSRNAEKSQDERITGSAFTIV